MFQGLALCLRLFAVVLVILGMPSCLTLFAGKTVKESEGELTLEEQIEKEIRATYDNNLNVSVTTIKSIAWLTTQKAQNRLDADDQERLFWLCLYPEQPRIAELKMKQWRTRNHPTRFQKARGEILPNPADDAEILMLMKYPECPTIGAYASAITELNRKYENTPWERWLKDDAEEIHCLSQTYWKMILDVEAKRRRFEELALQAQIK